MKRLLRQHARRKVIVSLKTGEAFGGVLFAVDSEAILLCDAVLLDDSTSDRSSTPIDGRQMVLRDNIAYLQFP